MVMPYLVFGGSCAQALAFYQQVFGGEVKGPLPYGDYVPQGLDPVPEGFASWVMHAEIRFHHSRGTSPGVPPAK